MADWFYLWWTVQKLLLTTAVHNFISSDKTVMSVVNHHIILFNQLHCWTFNLKLISVSPVARNLCLKKQKTKTKKTLALGKSKCQKSEVNSQLWRHG